MPQMSPMNWLLLFIMFSMIFMLFNMFNYYMMILKSSPKPIFSFKKLNSLNWKW